mmetsp:Transcript_129723/g.416137  ORF Transcript_129723/g.416137 Transcript_129723/m.416137 type:complete len:442 (-) Transcript_129723:101-1426(-)
MELLLHRQAHSNVPEVKARALIREFRHDVHGICLRTHNDVLRVSQVTETFGVTDLKLHVELVRGGLCGAEGEAQKLVLGDAHGALQSRGADDEGRWHPRLGRRDEAPLHRYCTHIGELQHLRRLLLEEHAVEVHLRRIQVDLRFRTDAADLETDGLWVVRHSCDEGVTVCALVDGEAAHPHLLGFLHIELQLLWLHNEGKVLKGWPFGLLFARFLALRYFLRCFLSGGILRRQGGFQSEGDLRRVRAAVRDAEGLDVLHHVLVGWCDGLARLLSLTLLLLLLLLLLQLLLILLVRLLLAARKQRPEVENIQGGHILLVRISTGGLRLHAPHEDISRVLANGWESSDTISRHEQWRVSIDATYNLKAEVRREVTDLFSEKLQQQSLVAMRLDEPPGRLRLRLDGILFHRRRCFCFATFTGSRCGWFHLLLRVGLVTLGRLLS